MSNIKDLMEAMGDKIEVLSVGGTPSKVEKKKSSLKDYVSRQKAESTILQKEKEAAYERGLDIDNKIVEYLHLKKHVADLTKEKNVLEKKLDAMFESLEGRTRLKGNSYTYEFQTTTYDKVVSKKEVIDAGLLDEFKARGFIKLGTRKTRVVGEL